MARAGVAPLLDFMDRDPGFRLLPWLLVTKGQARDILQAEGKLKKFPAFSIENMVMARGATSMTVG